MKLKALSLFASLLLFFSGLLRGQGTPSPALLVLAKHDGMLAIVDPGTLKVVARVPVGPDPRKS